MRQRAARLVHAHRRHVRPRRHGGNGQMIVEVKVRAVRLIGEEQHAVRMSEIGDGADVRAYPVIRRIVDEDRLRVRILLDCTLDIGEPHAERDAEPPIHLWIHIDRNSAREDHRVDDASMHIARQDDLLAALRRRQNHRLHRTRRAADHEEGMRRAERPRRQLLRLANHRYGMAKVVEHLHRIDVDGKALLAKKVHKLRVAASALVPRHVKRHDAPALEALQSFKNRRPVLRIVVECFQSFFFLPKSKAQRLAQNTLLPL